MPCKKALRCNHFAEKRVGLYGGCIVMESQLQAEELSGRKGICTKKAARMSRYLRNIVFYDLSEMTSTGRPVHVI